MTGIIYYYFSITISFLALAIYNLNTSSLANGLQCYTFVQMDSITFASYVYSFGNETNLILKNLTELEYKLNGKITLFFEEENSSFSSNSSNSSFSSFSSFSVPIEKNNIYSGLQKGIGIIYLILVIINSLLIFSLKIMSNLTPEDFQKMSKCRMIFGMLCKLIPVFNILLHWIILILIFVNWAFIAAKACDKTIGTLPGQVIPSSKFHAESLTLSIVNSGFWILLQYFGPLIRDVFYMEPFMYSIRGKGCLACLLTKLGP
jgi:hypothetical protein